MKKTSVLCLLLVAVMTGAAEFRMLPSPKEISFGPEVSFERKHFTVKNEFKKFSPDRFINDSLSRYRMTQDKNGKLVIRFVKAPATGVLAKSEEAFLLKLDKNGITVTAATVKGAWQGAARAMGILLSPDAKVSTAAIEVPEIAMADYPDIKERAMKIEFPLENGEELFEFSKPAIRAVAMFGFNMVFFDIRGNLECKKYPELAKKPILKQSEAKELIAYARACGLEVLPWTNTIGHLGRAPQIFPLYGKSTSDWVDRSKKNPIVMNIAHPDFYKVLFTYFDEVIQLFDNPRYFNIGCDEFHDGVKLLKEVTNKSYPEYFSNYLNRVREYLKTKKCEPIVWQDMFFPHQKPWYLNGPANGPADALKTLDHLPKDYEIGMWKYNYDPVYPHLVTLKEKGFTNLWAAPWYSPEGTAALSKKCYEYKAKLMGTTWWVHAQMQGIPTVGEFAWNAANPILRSPDFYDKIIDHTFFAPRTHDIFVKATPARISGGKILCEKDISGTVNFLGEKFTSGNMLDDPALLLQEIPMPWDLKKITSEGNLAVSFGNSMMLYQRKNNKLNQPRTMGDLIIYTPEFGKTTRANTYGTEIAIVDGKISNLSGSTKGSLEFEKGNMAIPENGFVLSYHGRITSVIGRLSRDMYLKKGLAVRFFKTPDEKLKKTAAKPVVCRFSGKKPNFRIYVTTKYPVKLRTRLANMRVDTFGQSEKWMIGANRMFSGDYARNGKFSCSTVPQSDNVNPVICIEYYANDKKSYPRKAVFIPQRDGAVSGFTVLAAEEFDN